MENILKKTWLRLEVEGKTNKTVPILLFPELKFLIETLLTAREDMNEKDNVYFFRSSKHGSGYFRACDLMRKYAKACGAKNPDSLKCTNLRKYIATMSTLLNLRDHELDALAKFMGHDIRVHRQYYRLSHETTDLAKISKLLMMASKGNMQAARNKNLDDIVIDSISSEDEEFDDVNCNINQFNDEISNKLQKVKLNVVTNPTDVGANCPPLPEQSQSKANCKPGSQKFQSINQKSQRTSSKKVSWPKAEKDMVLSHFSEYVAKEELPPAKAVDEFIQQFGHKISEINRDRKKIKYCIYNTNSAKL